MRSFIVNLLLLIIFSALNVYAPTYLLRLGFNLYQLLLIQP